jgi:hypothetical protein
VYFLCVFAPLREHKCFQTAPAPVEISALWWLFAKHRFEIISKDFFIEKDLESRA